MTEAKHTPGPWIGFIDKGDVVAILPAGRNGSICDFASTVSPADSDLMIAAPDMLDALQGLARFCEAVRAQVGMGKTQQARLDAARAAIAKATGAA